MYGIQRTPWSFGPWTIAAAAALLLVAGCTPDQEGPASLVEIEEASLAPTLAGEHDLIDQSDVDVNGARWISGLNFKVGTGLLNPFLSIQASPDEEGFNTDGTFNYDQTRPQFTDALPLNYIPTIKVDGTFYREFILDANEANSGVVARFSIDVFDLWLCSDANAPGFTSYADFEGNASCARIYDLGQKDGVPARLLATDGKTNGSGNSLDYQILIPEALFDASGHDTPACSYNPAAAPCGTYVVLKSQMGQKGGDFVTGSTFEEYSTIQRPYVNVSKTANTSLQRSYEWDIEKTVDPAGHELFEGESGTSTYTVAVTRSDPVDSNWMVSGVVSITNPTKDPAGLAGVSDVISGGGGGDIPVALDCGVTFPYVLGAGETLECAYQESLPDGETRLNTASVELEAGSVFGGSADIDFASADVNEDLASVNVEDTNGMSWAFDESSSVSYERIFTCNDDQGRHDNTATIVETGQSDDASVLVNCGLVTVSKTAATSLTRTWEWDVDKTVDPATHDLFPGESGTSTYTVAVSQTGSTDSDWAVDGEITVTNEGGFDVEISAVTDEVSGGIPATVSCVALPVTLAPGESLVCPYETGLPDGSARTNTASADFGAGTATSDPVAVDFASATVTEVNASINVDDTNGESWQFDGSGSVSYTRIFTCGEDEGENPNTATILETGQSDDASVQVNCGEVTVSKTAATSLTRTWEWDIDKTVDPALHNLFEGQSGTSGYTVAVNQTGSTDSDWAVSGDITVSNTGSFAVEISAVTDAVGGGIAAAVSCPALPAALAPGESLVCTYETVLPDGSARTNTASADFGAGTVTSDPVAVDFASATVTEVNGTVNVDDTNGESWQFDGSGSVTYTRTFTCNEDEGENPNTATIVETGQSDDASVLVNCGLVTVSKTAATSLTRTWEWDIDKSVAPATWDLFSGDAGTSQYTVAVDQTGSSDSDWAVSGEITVTNESAFAVEVVAVTDEVSGGIAASAVCGVALPTTLGPGAGLTCTYETPLPDGSARTNTASADFGAGTVTSNPVAVDFASATVTEVNATIDVTDSNGMSWSFSGDGSEQYERTFACGADEGVNGNTATIDQTGQSDDADVTVACYELGVSKDARTSLTRTWDWTIEKVVDPSGFLPGTYDAVNGTATIQQNEILVVGYDITLDATATDSDWAVDGAITVTNPHPTREASVLLVTDELTPGPLAAAVDCGGFPATVPAGGNLVCTYGADLLDGSSLSNTATATQQNFSYDALGAGTPAGTVDYSGSADVDFAGALISEIDECVDVSDILEQGGVAVGGPVALGTHCASDGLPEELEISFEFGGAAGIPLACGSNLFDNTGSFVTNDTGTPGSSTASVGIDVSCIVGCSLTQGYWKTHNASFHGGAPVDETWQLLEGGLAENTTFHLSGQTWYEVFWTAPQGNVYYNLAHQYMAAVLNGLGGADTSEIDAALAEAKAFFETYTPAQARQIRGQDRRPWTDLAGTLAAYNEGLTGPGHCTENQTQT